MREGALEPVEHAVQGLGETRDLVVRRRDGQPLAGSLGGDHAGAPAHRLHRAQRGGRKKVAAQRCQQEPERACDQQLTQQSVHRLLTRLERPRHNERLLLPRHGDGQHPPAVPQPGNPGRRQHLVPGEDAVEGDAVEDPAQARGGGTHDSSRSDDLRDRGACACIGIDEVAVAAEPWQRLRRLPPEARVDTGDQRRADAVVEKAADHRQHQGHGEGKPEHQTHPDGQPAHQLSSASR